jgi:hypothetical protein
MYTLKFCDSNSLVGSTQYRPEAKCTSLTGRQRSTRHRQTRRPGNAHFPTSTPQQERCIRHHTCRHTQRTHSLRLIIAPFGASHPLAEYRPSTPAYAHQNTAATCRQLQVLYSKDPIPGVIAFIRYIQGASTRQGTYSHEPVDKAVTPFKKWNEPQMRHQ